MDREEHAAGEDKLMELGRAVESSGEEIGVPACAGAGAGAAGARKGARGGDAERGEGPPPAPPPPPAAAPPLLVLLVGLALGPYLGF